MHGVRETSPHFNYGDVDMLKFYDVDSNYADYLRNNYDNKVPYITYDGNDKFICGTVYKINEITYYAPVSSKIINQRTTLPIYDKHGQQKSTIKFCFMFPAPLFVLKEKKFKEIDKLDKEYTDLLRIEYDYCLENEDAILQKANDVYKIGCNKNHYLNSVCCNFKILEEGYFNYIKTYQEVAATKQE